MKIEIPDCIIGEVQRLDALQSCRVEFFSYSEREEQLSECDRITNHVADETISLIMNGIRESRKSS